MRVVLVGADLEENLGLGMVAAALEGAGHDVRIVPFDEPGQAGAVAASVTGAAPDLVGLGIQFQHRAHEFLSLAARLRALGLRAHVTCGGHFPTAAWRETLGGAPAIDSAVLCEAEETVVELAAAVREGRPLHGVAGLAIRDAGGEPVRTAGRRLPEDLDALPLARRYRPHSRHVGVPFIPISGSRGCWGSCAYCSITTSYRDARAWGGGKTLRLRSPESLAAEMALLWHAAGGAGIFCFHDENFLLPRPAATLERLGALRAALDRLGVGRVALVGKCRPDCIDLPLARELRRLGVVRLYVGVENASEAGALHLGRGRQGARVREALAACRGAGIFACYNLLLFEPDATLGDVRRNVAFVRDHADFPFNFCRAEPYHGTPLQQGLARRGALGGSWLGWDYRVADDRAEVLFRVCSAAFRDRNFACDGVANRYMGLGYCAKVLEVFHGDAGGRRDALAWRARELTRGITLETADLLEEALGIAEDGDPRDEERVVRAAALLGLRIAAKDRARHAELDDLYADMRAFAREARERRRPARVAAGKLRQALGTAGLAAWVAAWTAACGGATDNTGTTSALPGDAGKDRDAGPDVLVSDPLPPDGSKDEDVTVVDAAPPDAGQEKDVMVVDDVPYDAGKIEASDPPPPDAGKDVTPDKFQPDPPPPDVPVDGGSAALIDRWRDTTPRRARRTPDLPLWDPPEVSLAARREGDRIRARLEGGPAALATRWEADGAVEGEGREVVWTPDGPGDRLRVAVRSRGGVAVVALEARRVGA